MIQIQNYNIAGETNANVYSYGAFLSSLLVARLSDEEQPLVKPFAEAVAAFKAELDQTNNLYGHQIKTADRFVDQGWFAMHSLLKSNVLHYDPEIRAAALKVDEVFHSFECPTRLPHKKAYGIYDRIISALRELPRDLLEKAGLAGWVEELDRRVKAFLALQQAKLNDKNDSPAASSIKARALVIARYSELVLQLNARLVLMPSTTLEDAAGEWNLYIDHLRSLAKAAATRKKKAASKPDAKATEKAEAPAEIEDEPVIDVPEEADLIDELLAEDEDSSR